MPDSGIGHTQDNRTNRTNEVWVETDTYQPTSSQPMGHKRRAGDQLDTRPNVDREVRREGTRWGTPRKRALFGSDGPDSMSSGSDVAEAQLRWPPDGEYPTMAKSGWPYVDESLEEARSPRVELEDAVARLQKDLAEYRSSDTAARGGRRILPRPRDSRDLRRRRFPGIRGSPVGNNTGRYLRPLCVRMDGTTSRQLFSYYLIWFRNPRSVIRSFGEVLVRTLRFSREIGGVQTSIFEGFPSSRPGDDPSVFAIELETLARRAFTDANTSIQLQLVRDRFITGQAECALRRHLDSMGPDTPMRDIVDSCRVWQSHTEATDSWSDGPDLEYPRAIYQVVEDTRSPVALMEWDALEQIMRQLLPTPAVSPLKATPIPSDRDLLIQRLLGAVRPVQPVVQERSRLTDIEILLQNMLPVGSVKEADVPPPAPRPESPAGCFSCGELTHETEQCPVLDESFPFLPPGWRADQIDDEFILRPGPRGPPCQQAGNVD